MATARKIVPFVMLALGCIPAWGQAVKNTPANNPQVFDKPGVTAVGPDAIPQAVNPSTYLIGPEDVLRIEVFRDAEMSRVINVRPDGKITMPLIGDLQAEGLTPERLTVQLKEALTQFENNPEVTISVLQVNSKSFSITGKVNRTGRMALVTPIRVFDALSGLAGGFQDFADEKKIQIIHAKGAPSYFNYHDFLKQKKKAMDENIFLQNGDTIVVR